MHDLSNVHMTAAKRLSVHQHAVEVSSNWPHAEGAPELVLQTVSCHTLPIATWTG
jgi:hypothetical protein